MSEWDVNAADEAVGRVLASVPGGDVLVAALRSPQELRGLVKDRAREEEISLGSEPARAVFRMILDASLRYVASTAVDSGDLVNLAHQQELRDLAALAADLLTLKARIDQVPAETWRLRAGEVLELQPVVPRGRRVEPSRLLVSTSGAFPFVDRDELLEELVAWVDAPAAFGVRVVGGSGGSGKSRLAVELCRLLVRRGEFWRAGFLGASDLPVALAALRMMSAGRLIVMDYAETRTLDVAKVLTSLPASATSLEPVRVLLLVRNPTTDAPGKQAQPGDTGPWVDALRAPRQEVANQVLDEAGCTLLDAALFEVSDRERLFSAASAQLRDYVDQDADANVGVDDLGFLDGSQFAQPLYVAMAAYLHVFSDPQAMGSRAALFEGVLEHEAEHWRSLADQPETELDLADQEFRLLVALATLSDASGDTEARTLLRQIAFLSGDANALRLERGLVWLRRLYPGQNVSQFGQLLPDRLGEYLVANQMVNRSGLIEAVLAPDRDPDQWLRPFKVLTRACNEYEDLATLAASITEALLVSWCRQCRKLASAPDPWASTPVFEALSGLVEAVGGRCDPGQLLEASRVLGLGNRLTAPLCLAIDRGALQATQSEPVNAARAEALINYANVLSEVGRRDEALDPAREAVDAYRALADANLAAYTPYLAMSLNNYAIVLAKVGKHDQALAPALEAVDANRVLADANPAAYTPYLAMSLATYANVLAAVEGPDQALVPALEAVDANRVLADADPAAYTSNLAASLNNYAIRLAEVGKHDQALAQAREAVELRRVLAKANPAAYTPDLAASLNNYANVLAEVGRRDEALDPAREAVDAYGVLAKANPAAYTPYLAMSLNNYAIGLAAVGRRDEALDPAREAVDLRRALAKANPAAYRVSFVASLRETAELLDASELANEAGALRAEADASDAKRSSGSGK